MNAREKDALRLRIYINVAELSKSRGLIKKNGRFETYMEGLEGFIDKLCDDIFKRYLDEKAGKKKPFYTHKRGLESAISVCFHKRKNTFFKNKYLGRYLESLSLEDFIIAYEDDEESDEEPMMIASKMENTSDFRNPIVGFNRTPENCVIEKDLQMYFHKAWEKLKGKGKVLHSAVIEFFWEHYDPVMKKHEMITALTKYLKVSRKKAIQIKHQALQFIFKEISKNFDLKSTMQEMRKKRALAEKFKKISFADLSKSIRKPANEVQVYTIKSSINEYSPEEIAEMTAMYCKGFDSFCDSWFDKFLFVNPT